MKYSTCGLIAVGAIAALLNAGCPSSRAPDAAFTATPRAGVPPLSVQFTDQSVNHGADITAWQWDFGDGHASTDRSPLHSYADAGTYTVALTVTNSRGSDTESKFRYIQADGPNEFTVMIQGSVPLTLVWIPSGSFTMGAPSGEAGSSNNERPTHTVNLTNGFWMSKYPVTKAQWTVVMNTVPWAGAGNTILDPDSPAVCITWADTQAFMTAINGLTSKVFRLPTEAEWEYACRAGTSTRFYWGDDVSLAQIGAYEWWSGNAANVSGQDHAHIVGLKLPNAWGLYDMCGNVWVWCQDYWTAGYPTSGTETNPTGPVTGTDRVVRAGGWYNPNYTTHRSAFRANQNPAGVYTDYGFRIVSQSTFE